MSNANIHYVGHCYINPSRRAKVAKLIGQRCMVSCFINGVKTDVLWDTGAQVSLIPHNWVKENLSGVQLKPISDIMDGNFQLRAANGTDIPYTGWLELELCLNGKSKNIISMPMLVSDELMDDPVIGYNVISELCCTSNFPILPKSDLIKELKGALNGVSTKTVVSIIELIQQDSNEEFCYDKTGRNEVYLTKGKTVTIECRVHTGPVNKAMPVLFEPCDNTTWPEGIKASDTLLWLQKGSSSKVNIPVHNDSKHDVTLYGKTQLGRLYLIDTVAPIDSEVDNPNLLVNRSKNRDTNKVWNPPVDLSHLDPNQREVQKLLRENCEVFSRDESDIGCIPSLKMKIALKDNEPVSRTTRQCLDRYIKKSKHISKTF